MPEKPTPDETLAAMREAAASWGDSSVLIEKALFGPASHCIRIKKGRRTVGPLLFPSEGQTIGQCLDLFLKEDNDATQPPPS